MVGAGGMWPLERAACTVVSARAPGGVAACFLPQICDRVLGLKKFAPQGFERKSSPHVNNRVKWTKKVKRVRFFRKKKRPKNAPV